MCRIQRLGIYLFMGMIFFEGRVLPAGELLPFALPWDDGSESITHVGSLLEKPAGKNGFIRIENGRFTDGSGKRFRILGVNVAFSGDFPTHEQSEKVAARMAKFGINGVRFHHMDTVRAPNGIWRADTKEKQLLDPENLDRLDYFISQLKQNGIYADLNLKVGRKVVEADGFPEADRLPTYDKGIDHYEPRMIELQKQFARDLLTHKNPYTGLRYVEEPAVAIIEINNESGLVNQWQGRHLDDLPDRYLEPLRKDWNRFLQNKYKTTQALVSAWSPKVGGSGKNLISDGLDGWVFQQIDPGKGKKEILPEGPGGDSALKIATTAVGKESWQVQIYHPGLAVEKGGYYHASLWLRADTPRKVSAGIKMDHSPWGALDAGVTVSVGTEWKPYDFIFSPSSSEPRARLDITGLGDQLGVLWVARTALIDGFPDLLKKGETMEDGSVALILRKDFNGKPGRAKRDFIQFLVERETDYYRNMRDLIHNELGAKSLVAGTQLSFGTVLSQLVNDFIDHHGYWQHPVFPGRQWDAADWFVRNLSLLNAENNTLERLMRDRVADRAYTVSEYNHPAPNTYASEGVPLASAYGAFQDWDGIFWFAYSHGNRYEDKSLNNFFDIAGHTPKMLAFPAAANLFLRGDIQPAREAMIGSVTPEQYLDILTDRGGGTWSLEPAMTGVSETSPYLHQTAVRYGNADQPRKQPAKAKSREILESDTGELVWNKQIQDKAFVLIRAERSKGFVGFIAGRKFALENGVELEIGKTLQDWANVLLTQMRKDRDGEHWLLTATGYAENQGMKWKNSDKDSVGRDWGSGPPLVEVIPLRLTFSQSTSRIHVYSLDERGARVKELIGAVTASAVVDLMEAQPSLWYEIVFEPSRISESGFSSSSPMPRGNHVD